MTTNQHPLTDEQAFALAHEHPLIPDFALAAFDAGREYERANALTDGADRPWEPLNGPVRAGDEVRHELRGVTTTAVVGRVDGEGDPWSTEDRFIGVLDLGTWYVRRAVQELPTEDGAVIVPADGCDYIETRNGKTPRRLTWDAESYVWYDARGTHLDADITPGTWKVEGK